MKFSLFACLLIVVGCGSNPPTTDTTAADEPAPLAVEMATVTARNVNDTIAVDGSLVLPEGAITNLAPSTAGKLTEVNFKEGDHVTAGQLLAKIDTRTLVAQGQSAIAGAASASATARQSDLAYQAAIADQRAAEVTAKLALEVAVADGKSTVDQAALDLQKLKAGARPQEIAQAQQAVDQARVARDKAKLDTDRDQRLLSEGLVAGSQVDASQAALLTAESSLKSAQSAFDLVKAGNRIEDIQAGEVRLKAARELASKQVAQARAALAQARAGTLALSAKAQEATAAHLSATQKQSDAQAAIAGISAGELRSPISGYVVRRFLNKGDVADATTPVFTIARSKPSADFTGNVSPEDARKIRVGMPLLLPGMSGRVSAIGQPDPETGLIPIRAHLDGGTAVGGFVTARVVVTELTNIASVQTAAILAREGQTVVFVVEGDSVKMTEVESGPESKGFTAILKGVSAGKKIVVLGGHELSDGARVVDAAKAEK